MIFLTQMTSIGRLLDFLSEPFGVLLFAVALIVCAAGLRWFFKWNEELANRAQEAARDLTEKTLS